MQTKIQVMSKISLCCISYWIIDHAMIWF